MSCLTTSATRRWRSVPAAALIASDAASSHEVPLVPMISVTLYTLTSLSFDDLRPGPGLLRPACHKGRRQFVGGGKCWLAWVVGPYLCGSVSSTLAVGPGPADSCHFRAGGGAGVKTGRRPRPAGRVVLTLAVAGR